MRLTSAVFTVLLILTAHSAHADENLFGYLSGAETLPEGAAEAYTWLTRRTDKGSGHFRATDVELEYEYGLSARLTGSVALLGQSIDTHGLRIDAYLPADAQYGLRFAGAEAKLKYKFTSALVDPLGLAARLTLEHRRLDPHSGQDKDATALALDFMAQKYFLDDQLLVVTNAGLESTYAVRAPIANLPADFEWPTGPEMELELKYGAGLTYRFAPAWFVAAETFVETEFETEVGQERWSWHAGPSLHYGGERWWVTLTWLRQLRGGGEAYPGQQPDLQLIEKTRQELRVKIGYNF